LELVIAHQHSFPCAVVGIDIAAGEEHFNQLEFPNLYGPHYAVAQEAKKRGIPLTLHAGEVPTKEARTNIQRAILEYGACRIGHGYRMAESVETMELVRSNNIHVEVCPTSSVETGGWVFDENNESRDWKNHPATIMLKHGVSLCLNSDDPAVFHTSLSWQYRIALGKMSLSRQSLVQMNLEAVKAAWCSSEDKERLSKLIRCYGHAKGIDQKEANHCEDIMHKVQLSWFKSKTDSFVDRVYLRNDEEHKT
jgi:adenosine deaminase